MKSEMDKRDMDAAGDGSDMMRNIISAFDSDEDRRSEQFV